MIREEINRMLDVLPESELNVAYSRIEMVYRKYMYEKRIADKGVQVTEFCEESEEIVQRWDEVFAHNLDDVLKETIYYSQYKWHMFSYEQQTCLEGEVARAAFDAEEKRDLYVMYQHSPYVQVYENASAVVAADFDEQQDIYIFDKAFTWTYVHTHESMCGPYFYNIEQG
ncbi:DUF4275 family protein [Paenibacillus sp. RRE4]|uniref:DUF4275 family protein n=1 Tax=Paenibacillus sp. RRE4 TaxID=2962587 RepID=UPI002880BF4F|nr:DUF4275 family protein [Paenibacillus sp. RRE4]MDT0121683.1 DUF4275 family protein [Paenibacillus sp. RRE4]